MKKSTWGKVKVYAIRKFAVGAVSVGICTNYILSASTPMIAYAQEMTRQQKVLAIFKLDDNISATHAFMQNPEPNLADAQSQIDTLSQIVDSQNKMESDYTPESWSVYRDALSHARSILEQARSSHEQVATQSDKVSNYANESYTIRHSKDNEQGESRWAYNIATDDEVNQAHARLTQVWEDVQSYKSDYQRIFGQPDAHNPLIQAKKQLDAAISQLKSSDTIAQNVEKENIFDDRLIRKVDVQNIHQLTAEDKQNIEKLINNVVAGYEEYTLDYQDSNIVITYTGDGSQTVFPLEKFVNSKETNTQPKDETTPETSVQPKDETTSETSTEPTDETTPETSTEPKDETTPETSTQPTDETTPETSTQPKDETTPETSTQPKDETTPETNTQPTDEKTSETSTEPKDETTSETSTEPKDETTPETSTQPKDETTPETSTQPKDETTSETSTQPTDEMTPETSVQPKDETTPETSITSKEVVRTEPIPFEVVYEADVTKDVPLREIVQEGQDGEKRVVLNEDGTVKSETVTKQVVNRVVRVGTKSVETVINQVYPIQYVADDTLDYGKRHVDMSGVNGRVTTIKTYTLDSVTGQVIENEPTIETINPITEIIRVGTKSHVVSESIAFDTIRQNDDTLDKGIERVEVDGQEGIKTTTTRYTLDVKTGQVNIEQPIVTLTNPITKIIKVGTREVIVSSTETIRHEIVPFATVYVGDITKALGEKDTVVEGQNGEKEIVLNADGTINSEKIIKKAINKVVKLGIKPTETVDLHAYKTQYIADDTLPYGERIVVVEGQIGTTTTIITYGVNAITGSVIVNPPIIDKIDPVTKVTHVGVKPQQHVTLKPFTTRFIADDTRHYGEYDTIQVGQNGLETTTITYTINDRGVISTHLSTLVSVEPISEIVKVGVKSDFRDEVIAFDTLYQEDTRIERGKEIEVVSGRQGIKRIETIYTLDTQTGDISSQEVEHIVIPVVHRQVKKGSPLPLLEIQNLEDKTQPLSILPETGEASTQFLNVVGMLLGLSGVLMYKGMHKRKESK
ncbi:MULTISPECIES: G5 domain-containing protein [unclassified Granulicatella]|uniref:G5 domain-containing protein n=1 Tax=unclassified Granulicatella TaxID=2630493 RepID=UPI001073E054|nr:MULTISPECIES: G5 domain-containing protein [unclassified Granulicatella]MBF0779564.1 G5 domain-containing protein [Granulicatella sp. 19428wC4_WM01]TFU96369.1 YSIRK-type signal peptide-containing protein [Granulicatella sp. WM01]